MKLPGFKYLQPTELGEACAALAQYSDQACILSGGTTLIIGMRRRLVNPDYVVNIKSVPGMNYIRKDDKGDLRIGALTTLESIEHSPLIKEEWPALSQAAELVAVPPIRVMATLGGNLAQNARCIYLNQSEFWRKARPVCFKLGGEVCNAIDKGQRCVSVYQGDLAPVLMAMDARVRIVAADKEKVIPLAGFFTGRGENPNILEPGDVVVEVIVPANSGSTSAYEKLRVRQGMDFPLAGVAVRLKISKGGAIGDAKLVLGAVGPAPVEVPEAAALLEGRHLLEDVARAVYDKAHPTPVLAMDAWYRRKMVKVLTIRAIRKALDRPN